MARDSPTVYRHRSVKIAQHCGDGLGVRTYVVTEPCQCTNGNLREFRSPNVFLSSPLDRVLAGRAVRYIPSASSSWLAFHSTSCCSASAHQPRADAIRPSQPWILPSSFCERARSTGGGPARRVRAKGEAAHEERRMRDLGVQRSDRRAGTSARTRRKRLLLTRFHGMRCCREPFVAGTQVRLLPHRQRVRGHVLKQRQFAPKRHCFGRPEDVHACADRSDRQMHRAQLRLDTRAWRAVGDVIGDGQENCAFRRNVKIQLFVDVLMEVGANRVAVARRVTEPIGAPRGNERGECGHGMGV